MKTRHRENFYFSLLPRRKPHDAESSRLNVPSAVGGTCLLSEGRRKDSHRKALHRKSLNPDGRSEQATKVDKDEATASWESLEYRAPRCFRSCSPALSNLA